MPCGKASALNLSLLSRGVGEVQKNGHEKVEVFLEPEDYYNWANNPYRTYLPPLEPSYRYPGVVTSDDSFDAKRKVPKTFTTRKGALLLFSEDLAYKTKGHNASDVKVISRSLDGLNIQTVDDLSRQILKYGSVGENIHLKFINPKHRSYSTHRQIRPGFSAKRYLSTWAKMWDNSVVSKLIENGSLTDRNAGFYGTHSHLRLSDNLSQHPAPYRLLRSMLLSPGALGGYTFHRSPDETVLSDLVEVDTTKEKGGNLSPLEREATVPSIQIVHTKDGISTEVTYETLEPWQQEEVLTDLLVKSAIHHAMIKQDELSEQLLSDGISRHVTTAATLDVSQGSDKVNDDVIPAFDMSEAVESLLGSQKGRGLLDSSCIPQGASESLLKGRCVPQNAAKPFEAPKGRPNNQAVPPNEHFPVISPRTFGSKPATLTPPSSRKNSSAKSWSGQEPLPPINDAGLVNPDEADDILPKKDSSSILEISTQEYDILPPITANFMIIDKGEIDEAVDVMPEVSVEPPTPQNSTLTNLATSLINGRSREFSLNIPEDERQDTEIEDEREEWMSNIEEEGPLDQGEVVDEGDGTPGRVVRLDLDKSPRVTERKGPEFAAGSILAAQEESPHSGSKTDHGDTAAAEKHSVKSSKLSSKKGGQVRGSLVIGPHGEVINVGGSIAYKSETASVTSDSTSVFLDHGLGEDDVEPSVMEEGHEMWPGSGRSVPLSKKSDSSKKLTPRKTGEPGDIDANMSITSWSYLPREEPASPRVQSPTTSRSLPQDIETGSQVSMSEQSVIDTLTEHAHDIATVILSESGHGNNLEKDIKRAAELWMDQHPPNQLSRSQSARQQHIAAAIEEVMSSQMRKSAAPSVADYHHLLRKTLTTVITKASGLDESLLPSDTQISPELLDALTNQSLSPEDIEISQNELGQHVIRSKASSPLSLKSGHIYYPADQKATGPAQSELASQGLAHRVSIPSDRKSDVDVGDLDIINYIAEDVELHGIRSKASSPVKSEARPPSIPEDDEAEISGDVTEQAREIVALEVTQPKEDVQLPEVIQPTEEPQATEELQATEAVPPSDEKVSDTEEPVFEETKDITPVEDAEITTSKSRVSFKSEQEGMVDTSPEDKKSVKSRRTSLRSDKLSQSSQEKTSSLMDRDEFVVGKPKDNGELSRLYGQISPEKPEEVKDPKIKVKSAVSKKSPKVKVKPVVKKKQPKKKEKEPTRIDQPKPTPHETAASPPKEPTPEPKHQTPEPKRQTPEPIASPQSTPSPKPESEEEEMDFIFVHDDFPASPVSERMRSVKSRKSTLTLDTYDPTGDESDTSDALRMITSKEARAAKRAAQAEKRKREVERKRRERDEQLKREKEEHELQERLKQELEEEQKRREEMLRKKKEEREAEEQRQYEEERDRQRRAIVEAERERRQKEEFERKLEKVRREQMEEERLRKERQAKQQKEDEERRLEEEKMMLMMAEQEREEYERKKKEEEERREREEEEERLKREEEARLALEEAKRLAEAMARQQAEMEARLKFVRGMYVESNGLHHSHDITRAFVFSYYELLLWLGLDLTEFDIEALKRETDKYK